MQSPLRRSLLALAVTLLLSCPEAVGAAEHGMVLVQQDAASTETKLSGRAALDAIIGNTIVTSVANGEVVIFFDANGALKGISGGGPRTGTWIVKDDKLCLDPNRTHAECFRAEVVGTSVSLHFEEGAPPVVATILQGNARNF